MINIFTNKVVYPDGWTPINTRPFNDEEKAMVEDKCEVVMGDYGLSIKCKLKGGSGHVYLQMSKYTTVKEGDILSLNDLSIVTLQRGDEIIERIMD